MPNVGSDRIQVFTLSALPPPHLMEDGHQPVHDICSLNMGKKCLPNNYHNSPYLQIFFLWFQLPVVSHGLKILNGKLRK